SRSLRLLLRRKVGRPWAVTPSSSLTARPMLRAPKSNARMRRGCSTGCAVVKVFPIFDPAKITCSESEGCASTIGEMPDKLLDNAEPQRAQDPGPDVDANAVGGPPPIPQVSINRSTVAELERRRILRLQASALLILAIAAVLTMLYVGKLILVVVLVSILIAFVLAPLVDLLVRFDIPNALASLIAVLLLVCALGAATYLSYNRALSFMQELPQYKARIQQMMGGLREEAEQIQRTTEEVLPSSEADKKTVTVRQTSTWTDLVSRNASSVSEMVLTITFVPFLVFFMLSWQDHVRSASVM